MLKIDVLSKNKTTFNPNSNGSGYGIWDLARGSIKMNSKLINIKQAYSIRDGEEMRPDTIAFRKMGDQGKMGSMLKMSAISNPFAIDTNTVLYIPTDTSLASMFDSKVKENKNSIANGTGDGSGSGPQDRLKKFRDKQKAKKFTPSSGREAYLARANGAGGDGGSGVPSNPVDESLPPNILGNGENQVVTKSGLIFFGPDATTNNT